jgi:hypothetical protein
MKHLFTIAALTLCSLSFYSCSESEGPILATSFIIRTKTNVDTSGTETQTFIYDNLDRQIQCLSMSSEDSLLRNEFIVYASDSIIHYSYDEGNNTPEITIDYLSTKELIDSSVCLFQGKTVYTITNEYNQAGYLVRSVKYTPESGTSIDQRYVIENGNATTSYILIQYASQLLRSATTPTYINIIDFDYNNKLNKISYSNQGIIGMGQPNKNLLSKKTLSYNDGTSKSIHYEYEFDRAGRVTKQYEVGHVENYTLFTYIN